MLNRPYNGLHGSTGYPNDSTSPNVHISNSPASPSLLPAIIPQNQLVEAGPAQPKKGFSLANLGSLANLNEIKGFVDRMGGLDGILTTVTKVQKVVGSITQMAPLVKVLMGSFGKKSISKSDDASSEWKPKRRKRRKTGTGSGRAKRSPASRRRSGARRRR